MGSMRKVLCLLVLVLVPAFALAQGVGPAKIGTSRISKRAAAHYVLLGMSNAGTVPGTLVRFIYPYSAGAKLVDIVAYTYSVGVGGTSWSFSVRNAAGTSLLSTLGTMALADGAVAMDTVGDIPKPTNSTRPVLKTDSTVSVSKGSFIDVYATETGTYSTHPTAMVVLVFEPFE